MYEKATTARIAGDDERESEEYTFEIVSYDTVTATVAKKVKLHEKHASLQISIQTDEIGAFH